MPNYAIHDGATVHNVIVCATQALAEELTGMQAVETEGQPWIGWTLADGEWRAPDVSASSGTMTPELEAALIAAGWAPPA